MLDAVPDLDRARRFVALRPPPGRVVLCAVTGSHHYGFTSGDSDVDLKGLHLAPTRSVLGWTAPPQAHDALEDFEEVEHDLTTNELAQGCGLLLRGNGNLLERVFSPHQLFDTAELHELRQLARANLSRRVHAHYGGYLRGMQRQHREDGRAKSLLYTFRVGLTGLHLLRTGEVVAHLPSLAPIYGYEAVLPLVEAKVRGTEKGRVPDELAGLTGLWERLEEELTAARQASPLPEEPAAAGDLEAWLVELRVAAL